MASSGGGIIKWGLIALAGWWVYENYFAQPATASAGGAAPPATTGGGSPAASTPPPAPPAPVGPLAGLTLDGIFAKLQAAAPANFQGNADEWNYYLMKVIPGWTAPDPVPVFSAPTFFNPPWTRDMKMPAGVYWAVLAPWLKTNAGLSGVNHYAGLAAIYGFGGRR